MAMLLKFSKKKEDNKSLFLNWITCVIWALSLTMPLAAAAQDLKATATPPSYPTKPVRLVVAVPPGSGADTITRGIALRLGDQWKSSVIVDNRPGAGGSIAMDLITKSTSDGYTLLSASVGLVSTAKLLNKVTFDPATAFEPVVQMTSQPYVVIVNAEVPFKTISALISYAQQRPGVLNYASSGKGSASHLGTESFKSMARIEMTHVPYKGLGQALTEMAGGQVQVLFSTIVSALPHIKLGRIRPIAITTNRRLSSFPNLPTVSESGLPGFELSSAYGIYAPTKTPREIINQVNRDISGLLDLPDTRARIAADGAEVADKNTPAQFKEFFRKDADRWEKLVKNSASLRDELQLSGSR